MRILICDFICEKAHRTINENIIRSFADGNLVDVVSVNSYYDYLNGSDIEEYINIIEINSHTFKASSIGNRLSYIEIINKTKKRVNIDKYDAIIVLAFEILSFYIAGHFSSKTPIFLVHHNDIDELTNKFKLRLFKSYCNKYCHIVFEQYFKDHLIKLLGISENKVFVIPHPIVSNHEPVNEEKRYDCVGLCNANSAVWLNEIEENIDLFTKLDLHILMRSKQKELKTGTVEFINKYLTQEEYSRCYDISQFAFIAVPQSYVFRLSGSTYDALSRRKIVFTTSKFYGEAYSNIYPGICFYVNSVQDLIEKMLHTKYTDVAEHSFDQFIQDHKLETVKIKCLSMLRQVCDNNL